jgi:hypothetical protein
VAAKGCPVHRDGCHSSNTIGANGTSFLSYFYTCPDRRSYRSRKRRGFVADLMAHRDATGTGLRLYSGADGLLSMICEPAHLGKGSG